METRADADAQLVRTAQDVCDRVLRLPPGITLSDNEFGALVCPAYNIGVREEGGADDFADSTVRRNLRAGDRKAAADAFLLWNKVKGVIVVGLVNRRKAERALFLTPDRAMT